MSAPGDTKSGGSSASNFKFLGKWGKKFFKREVRWIRHLLRGAILTLDERDRILEGRYKDSFTAFQRLNLLHGRAFYLLIILEYVKAELLGKQTQEMFLPVLKEIDDVMRAVLGRKPEEYEPVYLSAATHDHHKAAYEKERKSQMQRNISRNTLMRHYSVLSEIASEEDSKGFHDDLALSYNTRIVHGDLESKETRDAALVLQSMCSGLLKLFDETHQLRDGKGGLKGKQAAERARELMRDIVKRDQQAHQLQDRYALKPGRDWQWCIFKTPLMVISLTVSDVAFIYKNSLNELEGLFNKGQYVLYISKVRKLLRDWLPDKTPLQDLHNELVVLVNAYNSNEESRVERYRYLVESTALSLIDSCTVAANRREEMSTTEESKFSWETEWYTMLGYLKSTMESINKFQMEIHKLTDVENGHTMRKYRHILMDVAANFTRVIIRADSYTTPEERLRFVLGELGAIDQMVLYRVVEEVINNKNPLKKKSESTAADFLRISELSPDNARCAELLFELYTVALGMYFKAKAFCARFRAGVIPDKSEWTKAVRDIMRANDRLSEIMRTDVQFMDSDALAFFQEYSAHAVHAHVTMVNELVAFQKTLAEGGVSDSLEVMFGVLTILEEWTVRNDIMGSYAERFFEVGSMHLGECFGVRDFSAPSVRLVNVERGEDVIMTPILHTDLPKACVEALQKLPVGIMDKMDIKACIDIAESGGGSLSSVIQLLSHLRLYNSAGLLAMNVVHSDETVTKFSVPRADHMQLMPEYPICLDRFLVVWGIRKDDQKEERKGARERQVYVWAPIKLQSRVEALFRVIDRIAKGDTPSMLSEENVEDECRGLEPLVHKEALLRLFRSLLTMNAIEKRDPPRNIRLVSYHDPSCVVTLSNKDLARHEKHAAWIQMRFSGEYSTLEHPMFKWKLCNVCGVADVNCLKCSGCQKVFYCCKEHQRQDWKAHKDYCKANRKHS